VLAYIDAMTRHIQVPDAVFAAVNALHAPRQMVEITATVAAYNMVSRCLEAFQIHSHDAR
jgi:alkylhydroperoxidase family enzyme